MITIVPYDSNWPLEFREIGRRIRSQLGEFVLAIHHIGSTSVPGLAAKDVIDVQVSVADLDPKLVEPLCKLGLTYHQALSDPPTSRIKHTRRRVGEAPLQQPVSIRGGSIEGDDQSEH